MKKFYSAADDKFIIPFKFHDVELDLPEFECKVCGRRKRADFEVCCTGDVKRNTEKAPWCCGKQMIEIID